VKEGKLTVLLAGNKPSREGKLTMPRLKKKTSLRGEEREKKKKEKRKRKGWSGVRVDNAVL
jgi:hypothetical protein